MKPNTAAASNEAFASSDSPAEAFSVGVRVALAILRGYKLLISPHFTGSCRFLPSCSDYASEALRRHGVARGFLLTLGRLARCHPLCAAGHDPVPVLPARPRRPLGIGR